MEIGDEYNRFLISFSAYDVARYLLNCMQQEETLTYATLRQSEINIELF